MSKHTVQELQQWQSLPLSVKIRMTEERIRNWVDEYGEDGVYVSFSGGKDSTVLLDIARRLFPNIPAMFVDVPTQYPELKTFAQTWSNVDIIKPNITFMKVVEKYGFPLISKEISDRVYGARKYIKELDKRMREDKILTDDRRQTMPYSTHMADVLGIDRRENKDNPQYQQLKMGNIPKMTSRAAMVLGLYEQGWNEGDKPKVDTSIPNWWRYAMVNGEDGGSSAYNCTKYKFLLDAKFDVAANCCSEMKKKPAHAYGKRTGRKPITAQMASESKLRTAQWLKNGCNGFHMKSPISNPMSFWTEQDVLTYIYEKKLPICSVYGDVVIDYDAEGQLEGQMSIADYGLFDLHKPVLKTTGCDRTGCMLCGFGCHIKGDDRFLQLKETHPKMYALLDVVQNNGVTMREAIEWINENGNLDIKL